MEEVFACKCGNASATFECVGEDEYELTVVNSTIKRNGYVKDIICKSCGATYDEYDPCMVMHVNFK